MKIKIDDYPFKIIFCIYIFSINVENFNPTGYFSISKLAGITYIASPF